MVTWTSFFFFLFWNRNVCREFHPGFQACPPSKPSNLVRYSEQTCGITCIFFHIYCSFRKRRRFFLSILTLNCLLVNLSISVYFWGFKIIILTEYTIEIYLAIRCHIFDTWIFCIINMYLNYNRLNFLK